MAERIVRQLIDDLDGSEIPEDGGERIEFSLRGTTYQIDLSKTNAAKFDKAVKPFVEAAMKVRGTSSVRGARSSKNGKAAPEHLAAVRDWARKNGFEVADRGRIRAEVIEAFEASH